MHLRRFLPLVLAPVALAPLAVPAGAEEPPGPIAVPKATGLTLDGKPTEDAWGKAASIPADPASDVATTVKVLAADGRLWIAVSAAEDPGFPIGVLVKTAPDGVATAAEAVSLAYKPLDPRAPRYDVSGPRGTGRAAYRFQGAADLSQGGTWTIEAAVPFADLALARPDAPLRLAVAASLRTVNHLASAPAGAVMGGPATFALLKAPEGGWPTAETGVPAADAMAKEDADDARRLQAWDDYLKVLQTHGQGPTRFKTVEEARAAVLPPLDRAIEARPDLATLHWQRAMTLFQVHDEAAAKAALEKALELVPHFREPAWTLQLLAIEKFLQDPGLPDSDYAAGYAAIAAEAKRLGPDADAPRFLEGYLRYREADFAKAVPLLKPVVDRHPEEKGLRAIAQAAEDYEKAWGLELGFRKEDEGKDLPRAKVTTNKGSFTIELWEDDTPNSVADFVWLARAKFFDGLTWHRVVPFFVIQGGDPFSRNPADPRAGQGGPVGVRLRTEKGKRPRRAFRGVVGMANSGPDTDASQFYVMTGSDRGLDDGYSLFGRVVEGMEVADKIVKGDAIVTVEIVKARAHAYRPVDATGKPVPETPTAPK